MNTWIDSNSTLDVSSNVKLCKSNREDKDRKRILYVRKEIFSGFANSQFI